MKQAAPKRVAVSEEAIGRLIHVDTLAYARREPSPGLAYRLAAEPLEAADDRLDLFLREVSRQCLRDKAVHVLSDSIASRPGFDHGLYGHHQKREASIRGGC